MTYYPDISSGVSKPRKKRQEHESIFGQLVPDRAEDWVSDHTPNVAKEFASDVKEVGGNFVDDAKFAAMGFFPGIIRLGKDAAHDAKIATGFANGEYRLDDFAKAIKDDYSYTYGPAMHGDFATTLERIKEHPLGPVLDVLTLVTFGGGAAVKMGAKAASATSSTSALGRAGAKVAGLKPVVSGSPTLVKATTRDGVNLAQQRRMVKVGVNGTFDLGAYHQNPYIRMKQQAFDRFSERMMGKPVVGADRRLARLTDRREKMAELAKRGRADETARHLTKHFTKHEQAAFWLRSKLGDNLTENDIERVASWYEKRAGGTDTNYEVGKKQMRAILLRDPKVRELALNPNAKLSKAIEAGKEMYARTTDSLKEGAEVTGRTGPSPDMHRSFRETLGMEPDDSAFYMTEQIAPVSRKERRVRMRQQQKVASSWRGGRRPGETRQRTGYSVEQALDAMHPASLVKSYDNAVAFAANQNRLRKLKELIVERDPSLADVPDGYVAVTPEKLTTQLGAIADLVDEFKIVVGESPHADWVQSFFADLKGKDLLMPKAVYDELLGEVNRAGALLQKYDKATAAWRYATLNLRPAWVVNNIVGQLMLLLSTHGIYRSLRGMLAANRGVVKRSVRGKTLDPDSFIRLVDEYGGGVLHAGHVRSETSLARALLGTSTKGRIKGAPRRLVDRVGSINAILSDDLPRRAAFYETIRPYVKQLQKHDPSLSFRDAAVKLLDDDAVLDELVTRTLDDLVNFRDLSNFERDKMRRIVPFYAWLKGMNKRAFRLVGEEPHKALQATWLADYGEEWIDDAVGAIPEFLKGMIPIGKEGSNYQLILTTHGLNPYQTPADVVGMVQTLFDKDAAATGQNPLSTFNPFLKAGVEALANRDLFTGETLDPYNEQGFAARFLERVFLSTPITQSMSKLASAQEEDRDWSKTLYGKPTSQGEFLKWIGVPLRLLNKETANSMEGL